MVNMTARVAIVMRLDWAANCVTPIIPAIIVMKIQDHHSQHIIIIPNKDSFKYSPQSLKVSALGKKMASYNSGLKAVHVNVMLKLMKVYEKKPRPRPSMSSFHTFMYKWINGKKRIVLII